MLRSSKTVMVLLCTFLVLFSALLMGGEKQSIYWIGNILCESDQNVRDSLAQDLLDRGFTHVIIPDWANRNYYDEISAYGFKIIHQTGYYNLHSVSPWSELATYQSRQNFIGTDLSNYGDYFFGLVDDIEIPLYNKIRYEKNGDTADSMNYEDGRITTSISPAGMNIRQSFIDYHAPNYNSVNNRTYENLWFNYPVECITQDDAINYSFFIGYFDDDGWSPGNYHRLAQTFKPVHSRLCRIDLMIKRKAPTTDPSEWPWQNIRYYITETDANGVPDLNSVLYSAEKRRVVRGRFFDFKYGSNDDFGGIDPISFYFDPDVVGLLDVTKTYALVLEYTADSGYGSAPDWNGHYYRVASREEGTDGPYPDGRAFVGEYDDDWRDNYQDKDFWFKIYHPDPPNVINPILQQLSGNYTNNYLGYSSSYDKIAQTFSINASYLSDVILKLKKTTTNVDGDLVIMLQKTDALGYPLANPGVDDILASYRLTSDDFSSTNYFYKKARLHAKITPNETYALVIDYDGTYSTTSFYRMGGGNESPWGPYDDGMQYRANSQNIYQTYPTRDLYMRLYKTEFDINEMHNDWVDFQAHNMQLVVQDLRDLMDAENPDLKLYVYSAYQDVYAWGEKHVERYSADWSKIGAAGLDYAICGYGDTDVATTEQALDNAGDALLIGGSLNSQSRLTDRYYACEAGAMFWWGGSHAPDCGASIPLYYSDLPYETGFEYGHDTWPGPHWTASGTTYYRTQVTTNYNPHNGLQHLTMDTRSAGYSATNNADLHLDLSDYTDVVLDFWWKDFSDETHTTDAIYFSDDGGINFSRVYQLEPGSYEDQVWHRRQLDLDNLAQSHSISLTSTFVIRFRQYDNISIAADGIAIDDVRLYTGNILPVDDKITSDESGPDKDNNNFFGLPLKTSLGANSPNPFNPTTTINFTLAEDSPVEINIYNAKGQLVRNLVDGNIVSAGEHRVVWDGNNSSGLPTASGVYFYKMEACGEVFTNKMIMMK